MPVRLAPVLVFFVITGSCLLVLRYWIIVMVQAVKLKHVQKYGIFFHIRTVLLLLLHLDII
jgi:hypothetical protein